VTGIVIAPPFSDSRVLYPVVVGLFEECHVLSAHHAVFVIVPVAVVSYQDSLSDDDCVSHQRVPFVLVRQHLFVEVVCVAVEDDGVQIHLVKESARSHQAVVVVMAIVRVIGSESAIEWNRKILKSMTNRRRKGIVADGVCVLLNERRKSWL
jgi:hypothetical protein